MNSRFKTKAEEVQYRRAQILELKAQGHNQEEIAKIMNVTPTLISYDVKYMRKEAMETIKEYTTKELPLQFKATLIATQKAMKQYWDISQSTKDNKEKMLALENYLQCHMKLCRSLWEGGEKLSQFLVDYGSIKNEQQEQQQQHQYKHGDVVFTEGESPYIYHSPGNGNSNGNGNVQGEGQGLA